MTDSAPHCWSRFTAAAAASAYLGPLRDRGVLAAGSSRHAPRPALFAGRREVAHLEADGAVDLRITAAGWRQVRAAFAGDRCVVHAAGRRDWIMLDGAGANDWPRLVPLIEMAVRQNLADRPGPPHA